MKAPFRVAISAMEISGDHLGADLIQSCQQQGVAIEWFGIAGPRMRAAGCHAIARTEQLCAMGGVEIVRSFPRILLSRRALLAAIERHPPDLFIGIDAPDFHLPIARALKRKGHTTAQYVSPSVWAWRKNRIDKVAASVDLLLHFFPFEAAYYRGLRVKTVCTGHPIADNIYATAHSKQAAKEQLGYTGGPLIGLFPGSRMQEIERLLPEFLVAAEHFARSSPSALFALSFASQQDLQRARPLWERALSSLPLQISYGNTHAIMHAADAALVASGTATLELFLFHTPMVIAYRMHALSYWIAKRLVTSPWIGLPNILLQQSLVPEFVQQACAAAALADALCQVLDTKYQQRFVEEAEGLRARLPKGANTTAARALIQRLQRSRHP